MPSWCGSICSKNIEHHIWFGILNRSLKTVGSAAHSGMTLD